jgi:hypothetical protein
MEEQQNNAGPGSTTVVDNKKAPAQAPPKPAAQKPTPAPSSGKDAAKKPGNPSEKGNKKPPPVKDAKKPPGNAVKKGPPTNSDLAKKDADSKCTCSLSFFDGHRKSRCLYNRAVTEAYAGLQIPDASAGPQIPEVPVPNAEVFPKEMVKVCCCTSKRMFAHENGKCLAPPKALRLQKMLMALLHPELAEAIGSELDGSVHMGKALAQLEDGLEDKNVLNTPTTGFRPCIITPDLSGLTLPVSPKVATAEQHIQTDSVAEGPGGQSAEAVCSVPQPARTSNPAVTATPPPGTADPQSSWAHRTVPAEPTPSPTATDTRSPSLTAHGATMPSLTSTILASRGRAPPSPPATSAPTPPVAEPAATSTQAPTAAQTTPVHPYPVITVNGAAEPANEAAAPALNRENRDAWVAMLVADLDQAVQVQGVPGDQGQGVEDCDDDDLQTVVTAVATYIRRHRQ